MGQACLTSAHVPLAQEASTDSMNSLLLLHLQKRRVDVMAHLKKFPFKSEFSTVRL